MLLMAPLVIRHQKESLGMTYSDTQENQLNCARNYEHFTKQSETNNYVKTYHKLVVYNQMLSYVETVPNIFKSWRYYCLFTSEQRHRKPHKLLHLPWLHVYFTRRLVLSH